MLFRSRLKKYVAKENEADEASEDAAADGDFILIIKFGDHGGYGVIDVKSIIAGYIIVSLLVQSPRINSYTSDLYIQ